MNNWTLGYFYTTNTPYQKVGADYLEASAAKFNLPICITPVKDLGNWYANTAQKPKAILDQLKFFVKENDALLFLDADATIEKYPDLCDILPDNVDIAFHRLNWKTWYGYETEFFELLSGTIFIRNNERTRKLCQDWYDEAQKSNEWEQKVLDRVLKNHNVKVYELPIEYCFIKTRPNEQEPLIKCDPVILHHQVSRKLKK